LNIESVSKCNRFFWWFCNEMLLSCYR